MPQAKGAAEAPPSGLFRLLNESGTAIVRLMTRDDHGFISRSCREQRAFLARAGRRAPADGLARSYAQYRCQMFLIPPWKRVLLHLLGAAAVPVVLLVGFVNGLRRPTATPWAGGRRRAVYFHSQPEMVPESLRASHDFVPALKTLALVPADLPAILGLLLRRPLQPYFTAKLLFKLGQYRANLEAFPGSDFVVSNEYSFSCSYLTDWCAARGIAHLNVMHGEKLFYIRDAFVRFSRFYVWDPHYVELFTRLGADPGQFVVEAPRFLAAPAAGSAPAPAERPRLTYYLQMSPPELLERLRERLAPLAGTYRIVVRPHPRYSDRAVVAQVLAGFEIEAPGVTLEASLQASDLVVATYSTVLFQAFLAGRRVVIDDLAQPGLYEELCEMEYIMTRKPHERLSTLLEPPARGAAAAPSV